MMAVLTLLLALAQAQDVPKLIAHRGGPVDDRRPENSLAALQAGVEQGYWMLEVDLQRTRDGVIVLQHDDDCARMYGARRKVSESLWADLQALRTRKGNHPPATLRDALEICKGRVRLMIDPHAENWPGDALDTLEKELAGAGMLAETFFIGSHEVKAYFRDKAHVAMSADGIRAAVAAGRPLTSCFLFAHGNQLDEEAVRAAQRAGIPVVASVNRYHYILKPEPGPKQDVDRLRRLGVAYFQIDSEYKPYFSANSKP